MRRTRRRRRSWSSVGAQPSERALRRLCFPSQMVNASMPSVTALRELRTLVSPSSNWTCHRVKPGSPSMRVMAPLNQLEPLATLKRRRTHWPTCGWLRVTSALASAPPAAASPPPYWHRVGWPGDHTTRLSGLMASGLPALGGSGRGRVSSWEKEARGDTFCTIRSPRAVPEGGGGGDGDGGAGRRTARALASSERARERRLACAASRAWTREHSAKAAFSSVTNAAATAAGRGRRRRRRRHAMRRAARRLGLTGGVARLPCDGPRVAAGLGPAAGPVRAAFLASARSRADSARWAAENCAALIAQARRRRRSSSAGRRAARRARAEASAAALAATWRSANCVRLRSRARRRRSPPGVRRAAGR